MKESWKRGYLPKVWAALMEPTKNGKQPVGSNRAELLSLLGMSVTRNLGKAVIIGEGPSAKKSSHT